MTEQKRTLIIAEAGINHQGDLEQAKALVEAAAESGCDAIKFQTYRTELRVEKSSPIFDILKQCELTFEQQTELKVHADNVGIQFFSTPFDEESLFFLVDRLGLRMLKLASFDVTNKKFLNTVNEYAKSIPALVVIMSTGMANWSEIESAIRCLRDTQKLALLHCVSSYPTPDVQVNLNAIKTLKHLIHQQRVVGYSDHTNDILAPALAVVAGAEIIEKHFTLDLNNGAVDNPVSADPAMMKQMVDVIRLHEQMLGNGLIGMQDIEKGAVPYRRHS